MLELTHGGDDRKTLFVEVVLPLGISKTYTYRVPATLNEVISVGKRVVVQFGKSRLYTAIVLSISETPPELYEAKYLIDVLDDYPIVNSQQIRLWRWMSEYYLCHLGEIMQAALPAALKLASETKVVLVQEAEYEKSALSDKEFLIVDALEIQPELTVSDITKVLGQKAVFPLLKSLFEKGVVHISEELTERYKPKTKSFIHLNPLYNNPEDKKALFTVLERAPKQMDVLLAYMKLSRQKEQVSRTEILEESGCSSNALQALVEKNIFIKEDKVVSRINGGNVEALKDFTLTEQQARAYEAIFEQFESKEVTLLHGITSSGKTQVYIRAIEKLIAEGKQVLYLLPEIALTTQMIERLRQYFGNQIGVYHSKFSDNERAEVWNKILKNEYSIVLGARSAVFLPYSNLGLVIIDEEHENSYKQFDPAPRYHARDTGIFLAHIHRAKVLLGSATPSLESYYNAVNGKYGLVTLTERFGSAQLPAIEVVSIEKERQSKTIREQFTSVLLAEIQTALDNKEQVILFQNRRGYTPFLLCRTCGFSPKCLNCDVSLTFHKSTGKLHCHYCGYKHDPISICPACGSTHIEQKGYGTEKIEDDLQFIFPEARIARMDLDATRTKNSFQKILTDFEERKLDILVGTQMVAKGLDFGHVTVIGIINADTLLHYPDFRAYERSFQLLSQVAGRAGRRERPVKVIIQAYDIHHPVIEQVIRHDYDGLYNTEISERLRFQYPPYYRMIQLDVKHKDFAQLNVITDRLGGELRRAFGKMILGPEFPLVSKIRNYYIKTIIIKASRHEVSVSKIKKALRELLTRFEADKLNKGVFIQIDVDPY